MLTVSFDRRGGGARAAAKNTASMLAGYTRGITRLRCHGAGYGMNEIRALFPCRAVHGGVSTLGSNLA